MRWCCRCHSKGSHLVHILFQDRPYNGVHSSEQDGQRQISVATAQQRLLRLHSNARDHETNPEKKERIATAMSRRMHALLAKRRNEVRLES
jgi:hypothetical protein